MRPAKSAEGTRGPPADPGTMHGFTKERVTLTTSDNITVIGSYYDAAGPAILLLHQFRNDRSSWDSFAKELQQKGYAAFAIDFRGHGESQGKWEGLTERDFNAMVNDVEAAMQYLQQRGKHPRVIMGASIGANTALKYSAAKHLAAALLSPGLNYKGIDVNTTTSSATTLILVAKEDSYSYESAVELDKNNLFGIHTLVVLDGAEHGTFLLPKVKEHLHTFVRLNAIE